MRLGTGYHQPGGSVRVREVQRGLNRLGYDAGRVDGLFGPITAGAVRGFQAAKNLAVDVIVGPQTLRALRGRSIAAPTQRDVPQRDTSRRETEQRRAPAAPAEDAQSLWKALLYVAALMAITALLAETLARLRGSARLRRSGATGSAPHARGQVMSGRWIGARIHLVGAQGPRPDTVYVEPELFAKSDDGSQETTLVNDRGRPLAIATEDFEDGLRDVFVSEWLPRLEHALRTEGIEVSPRELESMPLVVELTADLRQTLAQDRWSPAAEEGRSDEA
jgi:peptidoglycan hydrolase-like protein with peptidoglycan-binding domain